MVASQSSDRAAGGTEGQGYCLEKINEMDLEFNVMMEEKIMELNAEFYDAHIVFCDVYQGIRNIIAEPQQYGMKPPNLNSP